MPSSAVDIKILISATNNLVVKAASACAEITALGRARDCNVCVHALTLLLYYTYRTEY